MWDRINTSPMGGPAAPQTCSKLPAPPPRGGPSPMPALVPPLLGPTERTLAHCPLPAAVPT